MKRLVLLVGLQLIAFWDVWRWYISRAIHSWDQPWGVLALVVAVAFLFASKKQLPRKQDCRLLLPSLLIVAYAASTYFLFPRLTQAMIAFTALVLTLSRLRFAKSFHTALFGLFYLSLPTIPSLQFFAGYPLRIVVAELTAPILRLGGFAVTTEGTCLNWSGQLIWIDAPCSGVKMLWVGMFLTCVLMCLYEISTVKTLLLSLLAFAVIIGANVFRAVALFYLEAEVLRLPAWGHEYAGLIAFALEAGAIVFIVFRLRKGAACDEALSST
jgi:exosortase/archaeosortase family protein